LNLLELTG